MRGVYVDLEEIRQIEKKWQTEWYDKGAFDAVPNEKPKYFVTVPYPYTSGALHVGHGRTFMYGDIFARYKRLKGYNVLFPMGFHMSGTPILAIADRIREGDKKTIELYKHYVSLYEDNIDVEKEFTDPQRVAQYFADKIIQDYQRMGYSIDWRRKFNTGEKLYNKFVSWQFRRLKKKGYLVQGKHPVLFSPDMGNPVGEDDIKDGDTDPVKIEEFYLVKFKYQDGYLVAATLRPETIFGVTNVWIGIGEYVKISVDNEYWYVSKQAYEKLRYQRDAILVDTAIIEGSCEAPTGKIVPIIQSGFVDLDHATGVVYSVPAHAPYDYMALKESGYDIKPEIIIGNKNTAEEICKKLGIKSLSEKDKLDEATKTLYKQEYYNGELNEKCGDFAGLKVSEAKDKVYEWLVEIGRGGKMYETTRKAKTRGGKKVIVAVVDNQWFINYGNKEWKDKTRDWLKKMFIFPEKYRTAFEQALEWVDKRPCARMRGIGTKLPFDTKWVIESLSDSTIYPALYTIIHIMRNVDPNKPDEVFDELFDYVFLGSGNSKEIADKLELSEEAVIQMRKEFTYWYPNDQRHTNPTHISNHLTFYIFNHTAVFPEKYWPPGITISELMIRNGTKMSKSKGNIIPLSDISKDYSTDLVRLYYTASGDLDILMDWRDKDVESLKKKFTNFVDIVLKAAEQEKTDPKTSIDRWFVNYFYMKLNEADDALKKMSVRKYMISLFYDMLNAINYYEKRTNSESKKLKIIRYILDDWMIALSIAIPHIAQEVWSKINKGYVHMQDWPEREYNKSEIEKEEIIQKTIEDIQNIRKMVSGTKIILYVAPEWKRDLLKIVKSSNNAGDAIKEAMRVEELYEHKKEIPKIIQRMSKMSNELKDTSEQEEAQILENAREYISQVTGLSVEIKRGEFSTPKANQALPGKPGIEIQN